LVENKGSVLKSGNLEIFLTGILIQSLKTISLLAFLRHILVSTESVISCPVTEKREKQRKIKMKKGLIKMV
jgi:hypothetical protein